MIQMTKMRPIRMITPWLVLTLLLAVSCHGHEHGHGHGDEHGHGHGGHGDEGEAESVALTLWTETHELFVEFDALVADEESGYHAHVTRIKDNHAATEGQFSVTFSRQGKVVGSISADRVARKGIFTPKGASPNEHGTYALSFIYGHGEEQARWDAGQVTLGSEPAQMAEQPEGGITFLKEAQWRIPFRTELPRREPLSRTLTVSATVQPDPRLSRTVSAPASGAVFWASEEGTSVIGMQVKAGQVLGRLLPSAAPEHWSTLKLRIERARIEKQRARATLDRITGLASQGLVAQRRVVESQAALQRAEATLTAARLKVGQLHGRAGEPLPLVAPADGVLVETHVSTGHTVAAGEVVCHLASTDHVLVRADLFSLDLERLETIRSARLTRAGARPMLALDRSNSELLTERIVIDPDSLSAPVVYRVKNTDDRLKLGDLVELTLGVGLPEPFLTVHQEAVLEINTRPYLFVIRTGESFDRRLVRLGPSDGVRVAVLAGLSDKDRVVTAGGFDVYAASLAGAVESHRH